MKKFYNLIKKEITQEYKEAKQDFNNIKIRKLKRTKNFSWFLIIIALIFYEAQYYFWPKSISNFFLNNLNLNVYAYFFIMDIITLVLTTITFKNELKESFTNFKTQIRKYFKYLWYILILFTSLNAIIVLICNLIVGNIPENQSGLQNYNIIYLIFSSLIYAPIVEELIYRGIIHKFISNDKIFIIVSGFIFGLAHVIGSSSFIQYIYIFDYGFSGAFLAFLYTKYNNIYLSMSAHFIMNLIATISMLVR